MTGKLPGKNMFIILPSRGTTVAASASHTVRTFLNRLAPKKAAYSLAGAKVKEAKMKVYDSVHKSGAKLVQMSDKTMSSVKSTEPGIRVVPVVYYKKAAAPRMTLAKAVRKASTSGVGITLKLVSKKDNTPVTGNVVAFTNFKERIGADGTAGKNGIVKLKLKPGDKIQRLYIYPDKNYWGAIKKSIKAELNMEAALDVIDISFEDSLRYFYKSKKLPSGSASITVGVLDTGVGPHPDLVLAGGLNCVQGEPDTDFHDDDGHGSHVAGIIAANGKLPTGIAGISPGVKLRSYRIFGKNSDDASNFAIIKAIDQAVEDKCDILNMSFGGGPIDPAVQEAIADAFDKGTICFVATGNEERDVVNYPAAYAQSLAVTAMGRVGLYPDGSPHTETVAKPSGKDRKNYVASFSNVGSEVDFTAPGVAIISTVPGGYAAMDGTSMACPAATGIAARYLSAKKEIMKMQRNQQRSVTMVKFLSKKAKQLGFGIDFEGNGMIR
jgi:subtilisin family serine protease